MPLCECLEVAPTVTPATPQDITKLIVRTSLKDRAAFDALYKATCRKLFGVCLRILGDRTEAEEALQEVYIKVWTKADRFAISDLSPISWLVAIARNHAIDRIRARRPATADIDTALDVADPAPGPEALAVAQAAAAAASAASGAADRALLLGLIVGGAGIAVAVVALVVAMRATRKATGPA